MTRIWPLRRHIIAWAIIIALTIYGSLTAPSVQGAEIPAAEAAPTVHAFGPADGLALCTAWKGHREQTTFWSGATGFPWVTVDWRVLYNGCDVVKDFVGCSASTSLVSVKFTWCGFYQSSTWNKDLIHVGANWQECSTPISGVGACWNGYVRQHVRRDGYMKYRWYNQQEPSNQWVWNSPY